MDDLASLHVEDGVATITLTREEQRNALSLLLIESIDERIDQACAHAEARVVVLTGAGRSFCAGMDLKQVTLPAEGQAGDRTLPHRLLGSLAKLCAKLRALPVPVVAVVNGAAIGGGCGLACVCDVCVSHADAKLGFPEVDLGLCPAVVAPWLVRKIGPGRARSVLLRGGVMSGTSAHELGIVDTLAPDRASLGEHAGRVTAALAAGGPKALAATKGLLNELDGSLDAALGERGAALSAQILTSDDAQRTLRERFGAG